MTGQLSSGFKAGVVGVCLFFAAGAAAIGVVGIVGVRSATSDGATVAEGELTTAGITDQVGRDLSSVHLTAEELARPISRTETASLVSDLYQHEIPAVDAAMIDLRRVHADDGRAERADLAVLRTQWTSLRNLLTPGSGAHRTTGAVRTTELDRAYHPLTRHIAALVRREEVDGRAAQARAEAHTRRIVSGLLGLVVAVFAACCAVAWLGNRRVRRAVEPAQGQVEFADTLQLAEDEDEAQQLLRRHLLRLAPGATATVLNRNNSADRLEAATDVPADSPLIQSLAHAEPRSCLAVRSGRIHDEDEQQPGLLGCPVCARCPGRSTCTPLTVGGEVIGSVLLNRRTTYTNAERQQVQNAVGQAAPVLANLRNLAIAELRAATDSLTGLPNKRAVGDTLKRMLAQASRTFAPMSLVMLDLDHFKDINDRFGHPVGDQVLANVGAAMRFAIRDGDFAGRNGGEEFAIILPDTDVAGAVVTAEKIRTAVADISIPGVELRVTVSVGVAGYPEHGTSPERLERLADSALYTAKRSGRDRIEIAAAPADAPPDEVDAERTQRATRG